MKVTRVHLGVNEGSKEGPLVPMCGLKVAKCHGMLAPGEVDDKLANVKQLQADGKLCPVCWTVMQAYAQGRQDGMNMLLEDVSRIFGSAGTMDTDKTDKVDGLPYMGPESKFNH